MSMPPRWNRAGNGRPCLEALEPRVLLSAAFPSAFDQYMLELINRARQNPAAEAARFKIDLNEGLPAGTLSADPREPLAMNLFAVSAAQLHSADLLANFNDLPLDHRGSDGRDPTQRVADAAGASVGGVAENNSWSSHSGALTTAAVEKLHELLFKDFTANFEVVGRGHRKVMLNGTRNEAGAGVTTGTLGSRKVALATIDFFTSSANYLTGVIYQDITRRDNFYTPGEGRGGVTITATRTSDQAVFQTTTWDAGGYSLALPAGTYDVVATGGSLPSPLSAQGVTIGDSNVKQDFVVGAGVVIPPGPANLTAALTLKKPLAAMVPGDKLALDVAITNSGQSPAGAFTVKLFRSADSTLSEPGDDLLATVQNTKAIAPGKTAKLTVNLVVGADWDPGASTFIVQVDSSNAIAETTNDDNLATLAAPELRWSAGTFAGRKNVKLTVPDSDGVATTIALKGSGEAIVTDSGEGLDLQIVGSDATTSLSVTSAATSTLRDIHAGANPMKDIKAPRSRLTGDINVGRITTISFDDVVGPNLITIANSNAGGSAVSFTFDQVDDLSINSAIAIKSYKAGNHRDTAGGADLIAAPALATLTVAGAFEADLRLTDATARQTLGKFTVGGLVRQATIRSAGHMGAITVGGTRDARFLAGVADNADNLPTFEQIGTFSIKSFTQKPGTLAIEDSVIAAKAIGAVKLTLVDTDNGGDTFGFVADTLSAFSVKPAAAGLPALKKLDAADDDATGFLADDFVLMLLDDDTR